MSFLIYLRPCSDCRHYDNLSNPVFHALNTLPTLTCNFPARLGQAGNLLPIVIPSNHCFLSISLSLLPTATEMALQGMVILNRFQYR